MASNKELIASIMELDPDAVTDDLNNAQLAETLKGLKAEATEVPKAAEPKAAEPKAAELRVPKGKAMTTLAGMKSDGDVITAAMVVGGDATLAALKKKGLLV